MVCRPCSSPARSDRRLRREAHARPRRDHARGCGAVARTGPERSRHPRSHSSGRDVRLGKPADADARRGNDAGARGQSVMIPVVFLAWHWRRRAKLRTADRELCRRRLSAGRARSPGLWRTPARRYDDVRRARRGRRSQHREKRARKAGAGRSFDGRHGGPDAAPAVAGRLPRGRALLHVTRLRQSAGDFQKKFVADRLAPLDAGKTMADAAPGAANGVMAPEADPAGRALFIEGYAAVPERTYRAAVKCLVTFDERANLPHIKVPVLCLAAEHDRNAAVASRGENGSQDSRRLLLLHRRPRPHAEPRGAGCLRCRDLQLPRSCASRPRPDSLGA